VEKEDWIAHAHVAFEGGENLVLQIQEDRQAEVKRRLVHQRYDWEILDQAAVTNPAAQNLADLDFNPTEFFVAAHAPEGKRVAGGTPFRISIQNHDPERFSPRPQEVWAEVTPVRIRPGGKPEETGAPYVFYEPAFEAKRPVPILEFIAHQWPGAEAAHVRLWFKLRRTPPLERRIEEVLSATADDWTIKTDAVKFAVQLKPLAEGVEGCQVVVAEQHAAAGDAFSTKVELSERPDAIRRDYYPAAGLVMHTFEYKQSPQARLHKSWLFITSAADLKEDAVQLAEPLLVRVPADQ
jgi:hypothetical protein